MSKLFANTTHFIRGLEHLWPWVPVEGPRTDPSQIHRNKCTVTFRKPLSGFAVRSGRSVRTNVRLHTFRPLLSFTGPLAVPGTRGPVHSRIHPCLAPQVTMPVSRTGGGRNTLTAGNHHTVERLQTPHA